MKRLLIVLLALTLAMSWLPLRAAEAASIIKTDDGLEFSFGMAQKVVFFTLDGLDLTKDVPACGGKDCNFRSFISPDTGTGSNPVGIWNFTNLLFTLSKGPVSVHVNLEVEAAMDENVADLNHLTLERANLTWKTGVIGDLVVGFDVHLFDPEGGLIYQDEDPGIWLIGSQGPISWNIGYHKRLERDKGAPLGNVGAGIFTVFPNGQFKTTDRDSDILEARVGFNLGAISISPLFLAHIKHTNLAPFNIAACPTNTDPTAPPVPSLTCTGMPASDGDQRGEIYYPGLVVGGKFGPLAFTVEGVGQFGEIRGLGPGPVALYGKDTVDIESFAAYGELSLDLTSQGLGITPFVAIDWRRGDDNPTDDTLNGYVPISDLSAALRKDGFKGQSISSLGPGSLGAGGEDGWGFNTGGRGVGPTLGSVLQGFGTDTSSFNSRWGKADNPGMMKATAGFLGKITPQVDMKAAVSYFRFDTVESIQVEAALNRDARLPGLTPAACKVAPTGGAANGGARARCLANTFSVSEDMGFEINANIGWSPVPAFRIQPFVSVFVPLDGVDDINRLFLDSNNSRTAYLAGVEFRAQF